MTCNRIDMGDGLFVVACMRGTQVPTCATPGCTKRGTRRCDAPVARAGAPGTCDRPICPSCAVSRGKDVDYCPVHARQTTEPR